jgi:hypothetical protein
MPEYKEIARAKKLYGSYISINWNNHCTMKYMGLTYRYMVFHYYQVDESHL